ncbi:MAG: hypothetical protein WAU81_12495 [Candidatus Aminicenantales bacterium]
MYSRGHRFPSGTSGWTPSEIALFRELSSPIKIQHYLNSLTYDPDYGARSPRWVIKEGKAHCFEGALFAAAALRQLGHRPLLVDIRSWNDDDHVLAVFKERRHWGCVAKSNYTVLRFREPVYRSIRELVISFFDVYFNPIGQKTMRSYSLPLDLSQFDKRQWMTTDEDLEYIGDKLDEMKHFPVLTPAMIRRLNRADKDLVKAGLLDAKPKGLYKPKS